MTDYQQLLDPTGAISTTVLRVYDQAFIPDDPANRDRAEYEAWLEAGGVPDPPAPPPAPPPPEPVTLPAAMPTDPLDAVPKYYVDTELAKLTAGGITPMAGELAAQRERIEAIEARLLRVERGG